MGITGTPSGTITKDSGTAPTVAWVGSVTSTTDSQTTYNLGNLTPANSGLLVVLFCAVGTGSANVSSATIGGVSATIWHKDNTGAANHKIAIFGLSVTAVAQAISVTLSATNGTLTSVAAGGWLVTNYRQATPTSTTLASTTSTTSHSIVLQPSTAGIWLGMSMHENNNATTWTSADSDANVGTRRWAFNHGTTTGDSSSLTLTPSWSGSVNGDYAGAVFT